MTLAELRLHRDEVLDLSRKRGAENVRVFGSLARGEESPDSDVDFLVDFEPGRSLLDLSGLTFDLERTLGCKVDVISSGGLRPRLKEEVLRDAVLL